METFTLILKFIWKLAALIEKTGINKINYNFTANSCFYNFGAKLFLKYRVWKY